MHGAYIFADPIRGGGWRTAPTSRREILENGLALGVIGALIWPVVARAKGYETGM